MSVLATIAVLALLVFVHESGHFLAARLQGIHVNRFSIGFGPVLWRYQGPQTEYALRGVPLGGFVGFPDDDPDSTFAPNDPDLLRNRPILDRAIVISAGVIANLIFAYFVLVLQFGLFGVPQIDYQPGVRIPEVLTASVAAQAGLQSNDIVIAVDGRTLAAAEGVDQELVKIINDHPAQPLKLTVQRGPETLNLTVTPARKSDGKGYIGVKLHSNAKITAEDGKLKYRSASLPEVVTLAADRFQEIVLKTVQGFGQLVTNFQETIQQVSGPVGIVNQGAKFASQDAANLFVFAAIVSINLAIINILPLPALDGGQLAFLLIEALLGKPLPSKFQDNVMQTGLVLLLGLGVFLIIRDTTQLEGVQKLWQTIETIR